MSEQPRRPDDERSEQPTADQPTVSLSREEQAAQSPPDKGLPTSDPVFPTSSPPLKPPADVSGFGTPGGSTAEAAPADSIASPGAAGAPGAPASGAPSSPASPARYDAARGLPPTPRPPRSAAEIRADIEAGRQELSQSVEVLRDKVNELTDWRGQVRKHRREITIAAAVVGFAVGARFMLRRRR